MAIPSARWVAASQSFMLLLFAIRLNADPTAETPARPGHNPKDHPCQEWVDRIKALEKELDDIEGDEPPFDKMSAEEVKANVDHRYREIETIEARRSAMGCPDAAPLKDIPSRESKPSKPAGGAEAKWTLQQMQDVFEKYAPANAEFEKLYDDSKTRVDGGMISFPSKDKTVTSLIYGKPLAWGCSGGQGESLGLGEKPIKVNDVEGTTCGVGEDMAGDWGAVVLWTRHGIPLQVQVMVPYPEKETPEDLVALFNKCRDEALRIAVDFDKHLP